MSEVPGAGGGGFFIENPRRAGGLPDGWRRGGRGAGRLFARNWRRGLNILFRGRNFHQENYAIV